jgi:uncharacterized membrane protein (Fun14 family)
MDAIYLQSIPLLVGLAIGLIMRQLVRGLVVMVALAGIAALVLMLTDRGGVLEAQRDLVPQAMTLGAQMIASIKEVLIGTPAALVGLLLGLITARVIALAKS